ncbi:MAG: dihydroorotase [Tissierellia bacterium]|nr:dihydroorotase [Tissierellia bacterium]
MILIKGGRVIDPLSKKDEVLDILIDRENIVSIEKEIEIKPEYEFIDAKGMVVAPGFIDVHVHFRDPGFPEKEDILSGAKSAARGGYTTVVAMANTKPIVDNVETLKYILDKAKDADIEVLQVATITKGLKGEELTDFEGLLKAGAAGFSDDGIPIMNAGILKEAMIQAKKLNTVISLHEEDPNLIDKNGVNKYSPSVAEDTMIARDSMIALHTGAKLNVQHLSSGESIEFLRWIKTKCDNIYAEVTPHHFSLTEDILESKGTLGKMNPPLRTKDDLDEIIKGLKDGTIDMIATDHAPHTKAEKEKELFSAPSGIIGLETALGLAITNLYSPGHLSLMEIIEKLTVNPAKLYNIDRGVIREHHRADLVIFDVDEKWIVNDFASKSNNSPFIGEELKGKVKYTISNGNIAYRDFFNK